MLTHTHIHPLVWLDQLPVFTTFNLVCSHMCIHLNAQNEHEIWTVNTHPIFFAFKRYTNVMCLVVVPSIFFSSGFSFAIFENKCKLYAYVCTNMNQSMWERYRTRVRASFTRNIFINQCTTHFTVFYYDLACSDCDFWFMCTFHLLLNDSKKTIEQTIVMSAQ